MNLFVLILGSTLLILVFGAPREKSIDPVTQPIFPTNIGTFGGTFNYAKNASIAGIPGGYIKYGVEQPGAYSKKLYEDHKHGEERKEVHFGYAKGKQMYSQDSHRPKSGYERGYQEGEYGVNVNSGSRGDNGHHGKTGSDSKREDGGIGYTGSYHPSSHRHDISDEKYGYHHGGRKEGNTDQGYESGHHQEIHHSERKEKHGIDVNSEKRHEVGRREHGEYTLEKQDELHHQDSDITEEHKHHERGYNDHKVEYLHNIRSEKRQEQGSRTHGNYPSDKPDIISEHKHHESHNRDPKVPHQIEVSGEMKDKEKYSEYAGNYNDKSAITFEEQDMHKSDHKGTEEYEGSKKGEEKDHTVPYDVRVYKVHGQSQRGYDQR